MSRRAIISLAARPCQLTPSRIEKAQALIVLQRHVPLQLPASQRISVLLPTESHAASTPSSTIPTRPATNSVFRRSGGRRACGPPSRM